jgi:hypothetical protein
MGSTGGGPHLQPLDFSIPPTLLGSGAGQWRLPTAPAGALGQRRRPRPWQSPQRWPAFQRKVSAVVVVVCVGVCVWVCGCVCVGVGVGGRAAGGFAGGRAAGAHGDLILQGAPARLPAGPAEPCYHALCMLSFQS